VTVLSLPQPALEVRAPSQRQLLGLLSAFCLFSALLGRFCFLLRPMDTDAAIFIYMGRMVCDGGRLCHDLIDNKFPTVGLMMSVLYRVLGICWPAYIGVQTAASLGSAWFLGRAAARVAGAPARLPTMLFTLVFLNFSTAVFGGFQLETMQVLFTAMAGAAGMELLERAEPADGFVAGLCAGCGAMFKPTAAGVLVALVLAMPMARRKRVVGIFALCAGFAVPLCASLIYLVRADLLSDMPALCHQISTYAKQTVVAPEDLLKPVIALALLGFPMVIRGFVCRRQTDADAASPQLAIVMFLILWLMIETAGVIMQRRMYAYHFLPMVPPAALLFGILPRQCRPGQLAAALVPIALLSISQAGGLIAGTPPGDARLPISAYLAAHAKPGDAVWMDAWPRLVLETGLRPASRVPFTFLFCNYDRAGLDYSAMILADFEKTHPAYIIIPVPLDHRLQCQIDFIRELSCRPERRASYLAGWHRIQQYALDHCVKEAMVGNDAVYRRVR
jgi:hypothetical protein